MVTRPSLILVVVLLAGRMAAAAEVKASKREPPRFLHTGSLVKALLTTAIFSYNLAGPVIAELDAGASFSDREVLPPGTKLIGAALVLKSNDRVNIEFHLAVLPNGTEIEMSGIALSPDGSLGIRGKVEKHKDSVVASAALKGALLGTAAVVSQTAAPVTAQATQSAAEEAVEEIDLAHEKIDTSIWVPAFTRCLIFLSRRLEVRERSKEGGLESP